MSDLVIRKVETKKDHARSVQVRTLVFVVGQNVPSTREIDDDEENSCYFIALKGDHAVGTGRWRASKNGEAKVERLAVLDDMRGQGVGKKLMHAIIEDISKQPKLHTIILGSQDHAIPFYESLGLTIFGEGYLDGGTIPHHDMMMLIR